MASLSGLVASPGAVPNRTLLPTTPGVGVPQTPLPLPDPAGDYHLRGIGDDSVIPMALGLLSQLQQGQGTGSANSYSRGTNQPGGSVPGTPGSITSLQGSSFHVSPKKDAWFRTALQQLGLGDKWRIPLERQAATESGIKAHSPMHDTLVGLMQQDTGQYSSMWQNYPGLRPQGARNVKQAYTDPVYAIETAVQYILGKLPGYGGYGSLQAFLNRGKTGY